MTGFVERMGGLEKLDGNEKEGPLSIYWQNRFEWVGPPARCLLLLELAVRRLTIWPRCAITFELFTFLTWKSCTRLAGARLLLSVTACDSALTFATLEPLLSRSVWLWYELSACKKKQMILNSHVGDRHLGVDSNFRTPSKRLRAMCSQHTEHDECRAEHINRHSGVMESRYKPGLFEDYAH